MLVGERGRRRRWLAIALAAALAVAAALLLPFLLNRGDDDQAAPPRPTAATPQPTGTSPDAPLPPPAGFQLYRDPAGWSMAVPVGWTVTRKGTTVTFSQDDRILRVAERPNPPKDPYDAAIARQPVVEAATPGYDFIRIASVQYRGWPTADWEYRAGTTAKTHSLIRSTVPSRKQVFDISWTCLDRGWTADKRFFDTAVQTFDARA
jgi:hypothetical protein